VSAGVVYARLSGDAGLLQMPEKTADTIDSDGWLHTGDLATMDGARLRSISWDASKRWSFRGERMSST